MDKTEEICSGIVVKAMSSFYHVLVGDSRLVARPRGRFKIRSQDVLAGDRVTVCIAEDGMGYIDSVEERRNCLVRPPVANIDQACVVFTYRDPPLVPELMDRILVHTGVVGVSPLLVLNKVDLMSAEEVDTVLEMYSHLSCPLFVTSAVVGTGVDVLRAQLAAKTSVMVGQSGVGKSRLLNALVPGAGRSTQEVSRKVRRGRHTTRHVELISISDGFIADTPGFSLLEPVKVSPWELSAFFEEIHAVEHSCRFTDCLHRDEPGCAVKDAVRDGRIPVSRYENYLTMLSEAETESRRY